MISDDCPLSPRFRGRGLSALGAAGRDLARAEYLHLSAGKSPGGIPPKADKKCNVKQEPRWDIINSYPATNNNVPCFKF